MADRDSSLRAFQGAALTLRRTRPARFALASAGAFSSR